MKKSKTFKILSILLCGLLLLQQTGFAQVASVELNLSNRFVASSNSLSKNLSLDKFRPIHLRSISYDQLSNSFKLLLDKGDSKNPKTQDVESATKELLNYFLVGLALPDSSFWVNLRPDAPTNIIDPLLAQTQVGKILLEADLQLKKDTADATNPATPQGKEYWTKLYQKANEIYGNQNVTIPTLTRPWIVPGEIIIRESTDNAYIYKATLKVMLEQDYLKNNTTYSFKDDKAKQLNEYSSQIIRTDIIPRLTKEINSSKRYAPLRQVYYSLILAQWFKARNLNNNNPYSSRINKKDLAGLAAQTPYSVDTYFNAYKENFTKGEYNIKEPVFTPYGQVIRSYFSGGVEFAIKIPPVGVAHDLGDVVTMVPNSNNFRLSDSSLVEVNERGLIVEEVEYPVSKKGEEIIKSFRNSFVSVAGTNMIGISVALSFQDLKLEDLYGRYDDEYSVIVVKDKVLSIIGKATGIESGGAFSFKGFVIVPESMLRKARDGDKEAQELIRHEERHNDYREKNGEGNNFSVEQGLIEELYAYFASFVDIYGTEALNEERQTAIGKGQWNLIVGNVLNKEYINGQFKNLSSEKEKEILTVMVYAASWTTDSMIKNYGLDFTLEYLKSIKTLKEIAFFRKPYGRFLSLIDNYKEALKLNIQSPINEEEYNILVEKFLQFKEKYFKTHSKDQLSADTSVGDLSAIVGVATTSQVDSQQMLRQELKKQAEQILKRPVSEAELNAVAGAHLVGQSQGHGYQRNIDGTVSKHPDSDKAYSLDEINRKTKILTQAGFTIEETKDLIRSGVAGEEIVTDEDLVKYNKNVLPEDKAIAKTIDKITDYKRLEKWKNSIIERFKEKKFLSEKEINVIKNIYNQLISSNSLAAMEVKVEAGDIILAVDQSGIKFLNTETSDLEADRLISMRQNYITFLLHKYNLIDMDGVLSLLYKQDKFVIKADKIRSSGGEAKVLNILQQIADELTKELTNVLHNEYNKNEKSVIQAYTFLFNFGVSAPVAGDSDDARILADFQALQAAKLAKMRSEGKSGVLRFDRSVVIELANEASKIRKKLGLAAGEKLSSKDVMEVRGKTAEELALEIKGDEEKLIRMQSLRKYLDILDLLFDYQKFWRANRERRQAEKEEVLRISKGLLDIIKNKGPPRTATEAVNIMQDAWLKLSTSPKNHKITSALAFYAHGAKMLEKENGIILAIDMVEFYVFVQRCLDEAFLKMQDNFEEESTVVDAALDADDTIKRKMADTLNVLLDILGDYIPVVEIDGHKLLLVNQVGGDEIVVVLPHSARLAWKDIVSKLIHLGVDVRVTGAWVPSADDNLESSDQVLSESYMKVTEGVHSAQGMGSAAKELEKLGMLNTVVMQEFFEGKSQIFVYYNENGQDKRELFETFYQRSGQKVKILANEDYALEDNAIEADVGVIDELVDSIKVQGETVFTGKEIIADLLYLKNIARETLPESEENFKEKSFLLFGTKLGEKYQIERIIPIMEYVKQTHDFVEGDSKHTAELIDKYAIGGTKLLGLLHTHPYDLTKSITRPGPSWQDRLGEDVLLPSYFDKTVDIPLGIVIEAQIPTKDVALSNIQEIIPEVKAYFYLPEETTGTKTVRVVKFDEWIGQEGNIATDDKIEKRILSKEKAMMQVNDFVEAIQKAKYQQKAVVDLRQANKEVILIGDLHARLDNLEKVLNSNGNLDKIKSGQAVLVILGDAVHSEKENELGEMDSSVEIMQFIMNLKIQNPDNVYYLLGNHDYLSEIFVKSGVAQGVLYEMKLKDLYGEDYIKAYKNFISASPLMVAGEGFIALHGGPVKNAGFEQIKNVNVSDEASAIVSQAQWGRYGANYSDKDIQEFLVNMGQPKAQLIVAHSPKRDGDWHWSVTLNHHVIFAGHDRVGYAVAQNGKVDFVEAGSPSQITGKKYNVNEIRLLADKIAGLFREELRKGLNDRDFDAIVNQLGGVFWGEGGSGKVYKFFTPEGEIVIKFFADFEPPGYNSLDSEVKGLLLANENPLFQQYITHASVSWDKVGYIVTKLINGVSFNSEYSFSKWRELNQEAKEDHFRKIKQRIENIPLQYWDQLVSIFKFAKDEGIIIDAWPDNFKYSQNRGFVVLDYDASETSKVKSVEEVINQAPTIIGSEAFGYKIGEENVTFIKNEMEKAVKRVMGSSAGPTTTIGSKNNTTGGIDFRYLPIVTQSMGSLKASLRNIPVNTLQRVNLNKEWSDIERLINSGITPSTDRLKEYFAASNLKGSLDNDSRKIVSCISNILRMEEESATLTNPTFRDMLVVLNSGRSGAELKSAFAN